MAEISNSNRNHNHNHSNINRSYIKKRLCGRYIFAAVLFILTAFLGIGARYADGFAQAYAETVYRTLSAFFGRIFGVFSFSVIEILLYIIAASAAAVACSFLVRLIRKKNLGFIDLNKMASSFCLVIAAAIFLYTAGCGVNYHRTSFAEQNNYFIDTYSAEQLASVCAQLTKEVNASAELVFRDENGVMIHGENLQMNAAEAMHLLAEDYPELKGYYPQPKEVLCPWILSVQQITGIYSPFTFEANYNGDIPDYNVPFSACHELSHFRGYMQEEEANFIAWLACTSSERLDFQYSGDLRGWISCMNVLYRSDYELWKEIRVTLSPLAEADLVANREYWDKYKGRIADAAEKINDNYLKLNGQADGIHSYGRMADLIAAYYINQEVN